MKRHFVHAVVVTLAVLVAFVPVPPAGPRPRSGRGALAGQGILADPFSFYYAIYLPNQQLQAMRPTPLDSVNEAMVVPPILRPGEPPGALRPDFPVLRHLRSASSLLESAGTPGPPLPVHARSLELRRHGPLPLLQQDLAVLSRSGRTQHAQSECECVRGRSKPTGGRRRARGGMGGGMGGMGMGGMGMGGMAWAAWAAAWACSEVLGTRARGHALRLWRDLARPPSSSVMVLRRGRGPGVTPARSDKDHRRGFATMSRGPEQLRLTPRRTCRPGGLRRWRVARGSLARPLHQADPERDGPPGSGDAQADLGAAGAPAVPRGRRSVRRADAHRDPSARAQEPGLGSLGQSWSSWAVHIAAYLVLAGLAAGLGYGATRWLWPDPSARLARDLSLAEHLDEYLEVGSFEFLNELVDAPEFSAATH